MEENLITKTFKLDEKEVEVKIDLDNDTYTTLYSDAGYVNKIAFNSEGMIIDDNNLIIGLTLLFYPLASH